MNYFLHCFGLEPRKSHQNSYHRWKKMGSSERKHHFLLNFHFFSLSFSSLLIQMFWMGYSLQNMFPIFYLTNSILFERPVNCLSAILIVDIILIFCRKNAPERYRTSTFAGGESAIVCDLYDGIGRPECSWAGLGWSIFDWLWIVQGTHYRLLW